MVFVKPLFLRTVDRGPALLCFLFFLGSLFLLKPRIGGDGFSYYAWLRSAAFDHDFNFTNEYQQYNSEEYWTAEKETTATGLAANPFSIGPAILWAPWFFIAFILTLAFGPVFSLINNGYSFFYLIMIPLGSLFYGLLGALLLYQILKRYVHREVAVWSIVGTVFGSMLINYLFQEPASSHPLSFFTISLLYWYWLKTRMFEGPSQSFFGGMLAGLMCLVRWQHLIFVAPIAAVFLTKRRNVYHWLFFTFAFAMVTVWQMIAWKIVYGQFFYLPQGIGFFIPVVSVLTWLKQIPLLLFSPNHGLFYWSPFLLIGLLGFVFMLSRFREISLTCLFVFTLSCMVNSIVKEYYGGWGYGARRMIELLPFLCFGVAAFWESHPSLRRLMKPVTLGFIVWNVLLWLQYIGRQIDPAGALKFPGWITGQITGIRFIFQALGQSGLGSSLYYGFTGNTSYFFLGFALALIYTLTFVFLLSITAYLERNENYV
ncbi:hypothetical protein AUK40_00195 [Candidatus Wirthbacteria bacterium CG2_30_54_11]|uniref:Glycosyltransferase RgtA/B/C/D-like domain-containing protein n=1 Tax=Candidatus Wirthbacteria bacterium CG2_30_54_11 TaxID=1817892 RepID=A0A1J5JAA5_9BACT|nr:MAG: hypothetical protein AUK40_00195 [Candidatus Wirthbacteria bacterium CG2_30_54_11]